MATVSARRSFHGPLVATARAAKDRRLRPAALDSRREEPTTNERERMLEGVLDALKRLTSADG
jgi:hypothetical protein